MVGVFASLKWTLVTSRLRTASPGARRGIIAGLVVVALALLAAAVGLGLLRAVPEIGVRVIVTLFFLQLVAWMLAPLVAFGVDETVDPGRFALLPLRPQTLQRGLLVTSLIGYLPAANAVILLGAAVGLSSPWAVLPVAAAGAPRHSWCSAWWCPARPPTSMAALMSSRRGRDLGMLVGFLLFVVYFGLSALLNTGGEQQFAAGAAAIADALAWTPPGALAALPGLRGRRRLAAGRGVGGHRRGGAVAGLVVVGRGAAPPVW